MTSMKTIQFIFPFLAFGALFFNACTEQPTIKPVSSKPDSVYVYTVDTSGNETLNRIIYYSYDAAKNQTCVQESFCTSKQIHKTEFQYNAKGLMIKKKEMFQIQALI